MGSFKRKDNGEGHTAQKRAKVNDSGKQKANHQSERKGGETSESKIKSKLHSSETTSPAAAPAFSSVFRDEEPAFPRGGGSVLTPLEQRQIQAQAKKDALFEDGSGRAAGGSDEEENGGTENGASKSKKKPRRNTSVQNKSSKETSAAQGVIIEGLSFKRIVEGSKILGQVASINAHDVGISLPNNLIGYVPLTAISQGFQDKIERLLGEQENPEQEDDNDDENENENDDDLDLKSYFTLGQYLRASVRSSETEPKNPSVKGKKHIELSVDPREANSGISPSDIVPNMAIQASVISVEDHGLIMNLGLEDQNKRGFMSSKELPPGIVSSNVKTGTVFLCIVTGQNANGSVVKLSANLGVAGSLKKSHYLTEAPTINSFVPGTAAEILLTEITSTGMAGKIMGMLDAVSDFVQSGASSGNVSLTTKYKIGAKIKARLVSTFPASEPYKLGFSLLEHTLKLAPTVFEKRASDAPALSSIISETIVDAVEEALGVYVHFGDDSQYRGFVHMSRLSDGRIESISADSGPFRIGTSHEARIVGFSPLDNFYLLSFEKNVIDQPFLRLEDVTVGAKVKGKIARTFVGPNGIDKLVISLADGVSGVVNEMHFSDAKLLHPEKRFREGLTVSARILSVDLERRQLRLTLKKSLLNSQEAIWKDYNDVTPNQKSLGTLVSVQPNGSVVRFYGDVRGFLPVSEMSEAYISDATEHFNVGQVLSVHPISVDPSTKRLILSCKDSSTFTEATPEAQTGLNKKHPEAPAKGASVTIDHPEFSSIDQLKVNDIVSGFVKRVDDLGLFVTLGPNVTAYVRITNLSDSYLQDWQQNFKKGQLVRGRIIVVDPEHNRLQMTLKESALDPNYTAPKTFNDLKENQVVTGKVRKVEEFGAFIVLDGTENISGLCHRSQMADNRIEDARKLYEKDDIVKVKILKIDREKHQLSLGLKASLFKDENAKSDSDSELEDVDQEMEEVDDAAVSSAAELEEDGSEDDRSLSEAESDKSEGGVPLDNESSGDSESQTSDDDETMTETKSSSKTPGLSTGGFDWTGAKIDAPPENDDDSDNEDEDASKRKKKHKKAGIQVDHTGDLDINGPQTVADYERLLLGEPNSSLLWLKYMAHQLELGEVNQAREIAERALRTISIGQDTEKLNVWVALLNLENTFGIEESLDEVFKRACQYSDVQDIHERLISIFIQSGKNDKADSLFQALFKKKSITRTPQMFLNYATFLFDTLNEPQRGRGLLSRAIQSLPKHTHLDLTLKFAQLEFRSNNGDIERGRTVFEGLISCFPKRTDLWNVLLDLEIKIGDVEQIRRVFRRALGLDGPSQKKLKDKQAKFFFKKWLAFEEANGEEKAIEDVKASAAAYVKAMKREIE